MIKIEFEKLQEAPQSRKTYEPDYYGPFTIELRPIEAVPSTTYARNLYSKIFIEFRFDHDNRSLYEVSLVAFDPNDTKILNSKNKRLRNDEYYKCHISEIDSVLENEDPMEFLVDESAVEVCWTHTCNVEINFFQIAKGCFIGVDEKGYLSSVFWELTREEISAAFGV